MRGSRISTICLVLAIGSIGIAQQNPNFLVRAELFARVGRSAHGLVFDGAGNLFACQTGFEIIKISRDGSMSNFATMEGFGTPETGDARIWDLAFGPDGYMYAAARDRIFRIGADGKMETIIQEKFPGPYGAVSIRVGPKGDIYVSYGSVVARYDPSLKKTLLVNGAKEKRIAVEHIIGIELSVDGKALYAYESYYGQVLKCSLKANGSRLGLSVVNKNPDFSGEYLSILSDRIVIVGPDQTFFHVLEKKKDLSVTVSYPEMPNPHVQMYKFDPLDRNRLYGTAYDDGCVYSIDISGVK